LFAAGGLSEKYCLIRQPTESCNAWANNKNRARKLSAAFPPAGGLVLFLFQEKKVTMVLFKTKLIDK
jgi:hypothetical protein